MSSPASLRVLPHAHTVYCDRKRQVCTAAGAVREGNRLALVAPSLGLGADLAAAEEGQPLPSAAAVPPGTRVTWYWDCPEGDGAGAGAEDTEVDGAGAGAEDGPDPTAPLDGLLGPPDGRHPDRYWDPAACAWFAPLPSPRALGEAYSQPPLPGLVVPHDDDPAAAAAAAVAAVTAPNPSQNAQSPLYSSAAALRLLRNEAAAALAHPLCLPLSLVDVGRLVGAVVSVPGRGTFRATAVGPVEAAPPRIREVWVEGDAVVGGCLRAHAAYYGGRPGACELSWVRVDGEGNRTEGAPRACDPSAPLPAPLPPRDGDGADPRCLRLGPQDEGCCFKACIEPVRADGVRGAPSTSKPSRDVAPAPAPVPASAADAGPATSAAAGVTEA